MSAAGRPQRLKVWSWRLALRDHAPFGTEGKFVTTMMVLSTWMNNDGIAWPSQAKIARAARCCERTVREHIAAAVRLGWLHVDEHHGGGKSWRYSVYSATVPADFVLEDLDAELRERVLDFDADPEPRAEGPATIAARKGEVDEGPAIISRRSGNGFHEVRQSFPEGPAMVAAEVLNNSSKKKSVEGRARRATSERQKSEKEIRDSVSKLLDHMTDDRIAASLAITCDQVRAIRNAGTCE